MKRAARAFIILVLCMTVLCGIVALISYVINRNLPTQSTVVDTLTQADMARVEEATHLRQTLGDQVWPGWAEMDIPTIVFNEEYAFFVGEQAPAKGWIKVPDSRVRGADWEATSGLMIGGMSVYRQPVKDAHLNIGSFTVLVGDQWTAAMELPESALIHFYSGFREDMPPVIRDVMPVFLFGNAVIADNPRYITYILHESFHAYQGSVAKDRLIAAEKVAHLEDQYPFDQQEIDSLWKKELAFLEQAMIADSDAEIKELAAKFLEARQNRRIESGLSAELIDYERQREWLEGLAKYAELTIGLKAATTPDYEPVEAIKSIADFEGYDSYAQFYQLQVGQVSQLDAQKSETRFYYTGAAEAMMLDRLMPDWKTRILTEDVFLEDLLAEAVK